MYSSIARHSLLCLVRAAAFAATLGAAHAQEQPAEPAALPGAEAVVQPQVRPHGITRISLAPGELPVARPQQAYAAQQRAPQRQMERDAITLRAARVAMQLNDASHHQQKLASR
ncbi:hypothetical protein [Pseudoduganella aquatica]|uniref:hypothetical protein n=1 Tax=Pseudoduganella aquatica TaxID=2660641 RepID=UPI001E288058|nr:hypothetical protein [Pseudoduganella aquatica]